MSAPKFPTLFISPLDRDRLSLDKTPTIAETLFGDVTHSTDFINNFTIASSSLSKTSNLKQITMTVQKINGDGLLNTTFSVGTIPVAFRPANNVSGTFPYGTFISDTGQIRVNSDGTVTIRTGDSSYIGDGSTVTITLLYI